MNENIQFQHEKGVGPAESDGFDYYVGYAPEHGQTLPYVESLNLPPPLSMFAITACFNSTLLCVCAFRLCFA